MGISLSKCNAVAAQNIWILKAGGIYHVIYTRHIKYFIIYMLQYM